jgi:uncharacterized NTF2-like protein DUF6841
MQRTCLFIAATLLFSSLGIGQNASGLSLSDKKSIDDLIVIDYMQAFIAGDYAKLRDCFQVPFVRVTGADRNVLSTLDAVIASYHTNLDQLHRRGYATSKIKGAAHIWMLAPDLVLVNQAFTRYKTDGSLLEEAAGFYLVSKSSGKWKIAGTIRQDPAFAREDLLSPRQLPDLPLQ